MKLALSSPYSYFFLPGNEMRDRVTWIEDHILPPGFGSNLRAATSVDTFVEYANQGADRALERFLEGIADTGRRGTKEALRVLYDIGGEEATASVLLDLCTRLVIAQEALLVPNLDQKAFLKRIGDIEPATRALSVSLETECCGRPITKKIFVEWADENLPMLSTPLSGFVHSLLFHGHPYPESRTPYAMPTLEHSSGILKEIQGLPLLMSLSFLSHHFGGKVRRSVNAQWFTTCCLSLLTPLPN
jgi:hypothetical protein